MGLIHLIYTSAPTKGEFSRADLDALLVVARKNNAAANISGLLLYQNGSFFQILEGERESVETIFRKISGDKRHHRITKIIVEAIDRRNFGEDGFPECESAGACDHPRTQRFLYQGHVIS
jgi:hypothetical protein